jgi:clan AA aspartic protease
MMSGQVNARLEPTLDVSIHGPTGISRTVSTLIDTGFGGELRLPITTIRVLALPLSGRVAGVLADGTITLFDVYRAQVDWDGGRRSIDVQVSNAQPLLGTELLAGYDLSVRMTVGGPVTVTTIP